jgi:hypothetical protein
MMTHCGHCGGRGFVLRNSYDQEGRARGEDERHITCEYCGGAGACEDGHTLDAARETPAADPADVARERSRGFRG